MELTRNQNQQLVETVVEVIVVYDEGAIIIMVKSDKQPSLYVKIKRWSAEELLG
jgi:hypothetical protein